MLFPPPGTFFSQPHHPVQFPWTITTHPSGFILGEMSFLPGSLPGSQIPGLCTPSSLRAPEHPVFFQLYPIATAYSSPPSTPYHSMRQRGDLSGLHILGAQHNME